MFFKGLPANGLTTNDPNYVATYQWVSASESAGTNLWRTIGPAIYWPYDTLVVIPSPQAFVGSGAIGPANPASRMNLDAHNWNGSYWTNSDVGFIGYWDLINAANPAPPVTIAGGTVSVIRAGTTTQSPSYYAGTGTTGPLAVLTVPKGMVFQVEGGYITNTSSTTATASLFVGTSAPGQRIVFAVNLASYTTLFFGPAHAVENGGASTTSQFPQVAISQPFYVYAGEVLGFDSSLAANWSVKGVLRPL